MDNLNEIFNSVRTNQENANAFEIAAMLAGGLSLSEIMDENARKEDKAKIIDQMNEALSSERTTPAYYDRTMIDGYSALMNQMGQFRGQLAGLDDQTKKSEKTLGFLGDLSKLFGMYNDQDEAKRLGEVKYLDKDNLKINLSDVTTNDMFINGFKEGVSSKNPEVPLGVDIEDFGINELKAELEESMKHSHSKMSVNMQNAMNRFVDAYNGATKPYTKEQLLEINKALKEFQDTTKAYVDYKTKENPTRGTGFARLQLANRILNVANNLSGRVEANLVSEVSKTITGEETVVARKTFANLGEELETLVKNNPDNAKLKALSDKFAKVVDTESEYNKPTAHREENEIKFQKAYADFAPELDSFISTLYGEDATEKDSEIIKFSQKLKDEIIKAKASEDHHPLREVTNKMYVDHCNNDWYYEGFKALGLDMGESNKVPSEFVALLEHTGFSRSQATREDSTGENAMAYYRYINGHSLEEGLAHNFDQDYINKAIKAYYEFTKTHQIIDSSEVKPYFSKEGAQKLEDQAKFFKHWYESLANVKIEAVNDDNFLQLADKYMHYGEQAVGISQSEEGIRDIGDDYYKHIGGIDRHLDLSAQAFTLQGIGGAARLAVNKSNTYMVRAAGKMIFFDVTNENKDKRICDLNADIGQIYNALPQSVMVYFKKFPEACERYVDGTATPGDMQKLTEAYTQAKAEFFAAYSGKGLEQKEEDKAKYEKLKVANRPYDMINAKIKLLEFQYSQTNNPAFKSLAEKYNKPAMKAKIAKMLSEDPAFTKFYENAPEVGSKEYDAMAEKLVNRASEELFTKPQPSEKVLSAAKKLEHQDRSKAPNPMLPQ